MSASDESDLRHELRSLIHMEQGASFEIETWRAKAAKLREKLPQWSGAPHLVWHYLDDLDIRMKDGRYANEQIEGILRIVAECP
jgi:hypothetical protein